MEQLLNKDLEVERSIGEIAKAMEEMSVNGLQAMLYFNGMVFKRAKSLLDEREKETAFDAFDIASDLETCATDVKDLVNLITLTTEKVEDLAVSARAVGMVGQSSLIYSLLDAIVSKAREIEDSLRGFSDYFYDLHKNKKSLDSAATLNETNGTN